jgi:hypothetical protein
LALAVSDRNHGISPERSAHLRRSNSNFHCCCARSEARKFRSEKTVRCRSALAQPQTRRELHLESVPVERVNDRQQLWHNRQDRIACRRTPDGRMARRRPSAQWNGAEKTRNQHFGNQRHHNHGAIFRPRDIPSRRANCESSDCPDIRMVRRNPLIPVFRWPELCMHILENNSPIPSHFQRYLMRKGFLARIELMVFLVVDHRFDEILPIEESSGHG